MLDSNIEALVPDALETLNQPWTACLWASLQKSKHLNAIAMGFLSHNNPNRYTLTPKSDNTILFYSFTNSLICFQSCNKYSLC